MDPEYKPANFAPGDEVPEWALDQVGDHVLEPEETADADEPDTSDDPGSQEQADDSSGDSGAGDESDADDEDDTPPPADEQPDFTAPAPARRGRARK